MADRDPSSGPRRRQGEGWLALVGGGEFSFGETLEADRAWMNRAPPGPIGFLPTASGSEDYGRHFSDYLDEAFERRCETVPIYRARDARRGKNLERLEGAAAIYIGGGMAEQLLEVIRDTPAAEGLAGKLLGGGLVVAIAAAAQSLGRWVRSLRGDTHLPGLDWLPGGVVEPGFDPGHDRRLRQLMAQPGVTWGLGLPAGSALLLGPGEERELVGTAFLLEAADGDLKVLS